MGQEASRWKVCAEQVKKTFCVRSMSIYDIVLSNHEFRPDYQHELWLFCRLQCGAQSEPERDNARQMAEIYALHCCCQRVSLDRYLRVDRFETVKVLFDGLWDWWLWLEPDRAHANLLSGCINVTDCTKDYVESVQSPLFLSREEIGRINSGFHSKKELFTPTAAFKRLRYMRRQASFSPTYFQMFTHARVRVKWIQKEESWLKDLSHKYSTRLCRSWYLLSLGSRPGSTPATLANPSHVYPPGLLQPFRHQRHRPLSQNPACWHKIVNKWRRWHCIRYIWDDHNKYLEK